MQDKQIYSKWMQDKKGRVESSAVCNMNGSRQNKAGIFGIRTVVFTSIREDSFRRVARLVSSRRGKFNSYQHFFLKKRFSGIRF